MNVLILDQDLINASNMGRILKENFENIKINVYNGKAKYITSYLTTNNVDLIYLDIKFYGAFSTKYIEDIIEDFPKINFIYYGQLTEGDYISKCMEIKGLDFFYRPIKSQELINSYNLALEFFAKSSDLSKLENKMDLNFEKEMSVYSTVMISSILHGKIRNEQEIEESFAYYKYMISDSYRVIYLKIDNYSKIVLTLEDEEKNRLLFNFKTIMCRHLDRSTIYHYNDFTSVCAILSNSNDLVKLTNICEDINKEIKLSLNVTTSIGIGRCYPNLKDIYISFKEAESALIYRYYLGENAVLPLEFLEHKDNIHYNYPHEQETKLIYSAAIGNYEYSYELLKRIIVPLKEIPYNSSFYQKYTLSIIISINRFCEERQIVLDDYMNSLFGIKEVFNIKTADDAFEYLNDFLSKFCKHMIELKDKYYLNYIERADKYIIENYRENLTVANIADAIGVFSEFLNKVYFDYKHMYILDFITDVRLTAAKKLLRESNKSDYSIALSVGYKNEKYFKSVFQRYEKISTTSYRAKFSIPYNNLKL